MEEQFKEKIIEPLAENARPKKEKEVARIIKNLCGGREGIYLDENESPVVFVLQKGDSDDENTAYVLQFVSGSKEALEKLENKATEAGIDCRICWGAKKNAKNGK